MCHSIACLIVHEADACKIRASIGKCAWAECTMPSLSVVTVLCVMDARTREQHSTASKKIAKPELTSAKSRPPRRVPEARTFSRHLPINQSLASNMTRKCSPVYTENLACMRHHVYRPGMRLDTYLMMLVGSRNECTDPASSSTCERQLHD